MDTPVCCTLITAFTAVSSGPQQQQQTCTTSQLSIHQEPQLHLHLSKQTITLSIQPASLIIPFLCRGLAHWTPSKSERGESLTLDSLECREKKRPHYVPVGSQHLWSAPLPVSVELVEKHFPFSISFPASGSVSPTYCSRCGTEQIKKTPGWG